MTTPTYEEMYEVLHRMYIARNITLNSGEMIKCLLILDEWFEPESIETLRQELLKD